jgi:hypothetical protein
MSLSVKRGMNDSNVAHRGCRTPGGDVAGSMNRKSSTYYRGGGHFLWNGGELAERVRGKNNGRVRTTFTTDNLDSAITHEDV